MSWNPVLNLILEIKKDYKEKFNDNSLNFEEWLEKLNNKKYNDIFECLQVNQKDEFVLIRYGLQEMQQGMWEEQDSIYRECRSIVIDLDKEQLVLAPFRKFFNLDEVEENKLDKIKGKFNKAKIVEVSNKLDGSMQNARWYNDTVFIAGSMSLDKDFSWRLKHGHSMLSENYIQMIRTYPNYTFTFEYISLQDAHVVKYNKEDEGMYLIGIRDVETGRQLFYYELINLAKQYDIKHVELENKTLEQLLKEMKEVKSNDKEGWILNLDGHLLKLKCDDYVSIHRLLDKVSSVNVIIENVAENRVDDLLSKVPDAHKERVIATVDELLKYVKFNTSKINNYFKNAPKNNRKEFMIWVNENVPKYLQVYVRNEYLGLPYNILKNFNGGYKKYSELELDKTI